MFINTKFVISKQDNLFKCAQKRQSNKSQNNMISLGKQKC